jgi:hypothetical protein
MADRGVQESDNKDPGREQGEHFEGHGGVHWFRFVDDAGSSAFLQLPSSLAVAR